MAQRKPSQPDKKQEDIPLPAPIPRPTNVLTVSAPTTDNPAVYFLGPLPIIPDPLLELMCAKIFRRTEDIVTPFTTLCIFVQCAPGHIVPGPASTERFSLTAAPCRSPGETLGLVMALRYSHSYSAQHLRRIRANPPDS